MVHESVFGIEYYVKLDKAYDYYDIIPELEVYFRCRFTISYDKTVITVINYEATQARYMTTKQYKERSTNQYKCVDDFNHLPYDEWMNLNDAERNFYIENRDLNRQKQLLENMPIQPTPEETNFIEAVKNKLGERFVSGYWDISYTFL